MSLSSSSVKEKQTGTEKNSVFDSEILSARIVANYGDPGITEKYMYDILSRFLIVMIEPTNRVPVTTSFSHMFMLVQRPEHLWISVDGQIQSNIDNQRRADQDGNINKGDPSNYSLDNIPSINRPYRLGEKIKIRKLEQTIPFGNQLFSSDYDVSYLSNGSFNKYNENYLTKDPVGSANVSNNPTKYSNVKTFPLYDAGGVRDFKYKGVTYSNGFSEYLPNFNVLNNSGNPQAATRTSFDSTKQYGVGLNKYTFEVFWRFIASNLAQTDAVILGTASNYNKLPSGKLYLWDNNKNGGNWARSIILFTSCGYEDMNVDGKFRDANNQCLPLVVTNPSDFPIPQTKQAGSIKFDPTFQQIVSS